MVSTIKFSQMTPGGDLTNGEQIPGLLLGGNVLIDVPWTFLAPGSTGSRPAPVSAIYYRLRFNTTLQLYEYYDPTSASWISLSGSVNPGLANNLAFYASNGTTLSPIATANSALLVTTSTGAPSWSSSLTNGQVIIGSTGATPTAATLTAGTGISIANAAGSITISNTGAVVTPSALTKTDDTNVTLTLGGSPATALLQSTSLTLGWIGILSGTRGGTGVNNGVNTLTLAGNLATIGAFPSNFTMTGATNVTLPTSGTLATTSQIPTGAALTEFDDTNVTLTLGGSPSTALVNAASITAGWTGQLSLARGGTAANLTASNGGIVYSNAASFAILSGTVTANQILMSGSSSSPSWSTATYPATAISSGTILRANGTNWLASTATFADTYAASSLLYSNGANTVTGLGTTNSASLVTTSAGVPVWSSTMTDGQVIIGSSGATPTAATLTAGSGISITNAAGSITIANTGGSVTPAALTRVDDTNVTLTLGGTPLTALLQATSITAGWTGTLSGTRGGTGVNNGANTATYAGNLSFASSFTTSGAFAVTQTYTGITNVTFPTSGTLATTTQLPTPAALTKTDDTNITITLGGTPSTALLQATSLTMGWTGTLSGTRGGTGVNNGASTITLGGSLTTSGAFASTFTMTGITAVTFPTTGTLATTTQLPTPAALTKVDDTNVTLTLGGTPATSLLQATSLTLGWTGQLGLTRGGTNASLTASNGGIVYSSGTAMAILAGTATAGKILQSGSSTTPSWSTATYPATAGTLGNVLTSDGTNFISSPNTSTGGANISNILFLMGG